MTMSNADHRPPRPPAAGPTVDELFLGVFDPGEVEAFLVDLNAMRRSDVA